MSTTLVQTPNGSTPPVAQRPKKNNLLWLAIACLLLSLVVRNVSHLDTQAQQYRARAEGGSRIVGGDWFAGMLLGFREAVADLMWIQVDQYFHEGRFDKILPLCYIITAMDPGWIEVYTTGAWHLGYNFGDRRLVPAAIAFDKRGTDNNPRNADMWYELGTMESSRGYDFKDAAIHLKKANDLGLQPVGRRHAWPHALESSGDIPGAIAAWESILKSDPRDVVAKKQIFLANMRTLARNDLKNAPIEVHFDVKVTRKGPRVLNIEGITNLPKYTKIFYELRDLDWRDRQQKPLAWQLGHYTLYSQNDSTLQPAVGMFRGEEIDFYQGTLHIHQGDKQYNQFPTEPVVPIVNGHLMLQNGYFHTEIDMAKLSDQYPLESARYELKLFVDPRIEPISTQDLISWDGSGMTGPLCHWENGRNIMSWTDILTKQDLD